MLLLSAAVTGSHQFRRNVSHWPGRTAWRLATHPTAGLSGFKPLLSYLPAATLAPSPNAHFYSAFSMVPTPHGKPKTLLHIVPNSSCSTSGLRECLAVTAAGKPEQEEGWLYLLIHRFISLAGVAGRRCPPSPRVSLLEMLRRQKGS